MNGERLNAERRFITVGTTGGRTNLRLNVMALALSVAVAGIAGTTLPATAQAQTVETQQQVSIPAGTLREALDALASQSGITVMYSPELVAGKTSRGLSGRYTATEALRRLLTGSGLEAQDAGDSTFTLKRTSAPSTEPPAQAQNAQAAAPPTEPEVKELEKMTVTGTRIRGVQPSSPLVMISQEEMRLAGHNNLGEVIRALPQNFSGGQNPGVLTGAGGDITANQNVTGASSLNLRGLGPDATLTLLNGARLAYNGFVQATDVAVIPVAAIDRMDVLLDGASAIYGSDAVGGVVNVVLKRDYDGAEISVRGGKATEGGYDQTQVNAVVGQTWGSGGIMIAGESSNSGQVLASQRDYLNYINSPELVTIYPKTSQDGVLISGHQKLGSRAELAMDAFYTKRTMSTQYLYSPLYVRYGSETSVYGISPSLQVSLSGEWSMRVHAFRGEDESSVPQYNYMIDTGAELSRTRTLSTNQAEAAGFEFEGPLFALPGGDARLSVGAGWRKAEYEQISLVTGAAVVAGASNSSRYGYGEINLPLLGDANDIPFVNRLSLNGAFRYEDYDSFGETSTPKIGAVWDITPSVGIRASWGKSFKAPTLYQQYSRGTVALRTAASLGITNAPAGATVLTVTGGNRDLEPERAEVVTAGVVFRPEFLPGATVEVGWFDIDYTQRVVQPFQFATLAQYGPTLNDPAYENFISQNPTDAEQQAFIQSANFYNYAGVAYDPAQVIAAFDNRNTNASSQKVKGIDLDVRYTVPALGGTLSLGTAGSWIVNSERKLIDMSPAFDTAGVIAFPPRFKGRANAVWSRSGYSIAATVNHLGGINNTNIVSRPKGESMTTLDLVFDIMGEGGSLDGLGFSLSVMNVFNQRPPLIDAPTPFFVNYDSTNYSALGRLISATISKRF